MITLATESDVNELVALHHQVFNADSHYAIYFGEPFIRHIMTWYCQGPRRFTLLARKESRLAGYTCLNLGTYNDVFYSNARYAVGALFADPRFSWLRQFCAACEGCSRQGLPRVGVMLRRDTWL